MVFFRRVNLMFGLLSFVFIMVMTSLAFAGNTDQLINCDIQNQPCSQTVSKGSVTFDIKPKPVKAMEDLIFELKVNNLNLSGPPVIDLGMPGMKMGRNQVKMTKTEKEGYKGTGIIVRCPSGKTIWRATVNLPGIGSIDFIFDVIY